MKNKNEKHKYFILRLTDENCNYNYYGFIRYNFTSEKLLDLSIIKRHILLAKSRGASLILLIGKELNQRKDLIQIAEYIYNCNLHFGVITDGLEFANKEYLNKLFNLGLELICLNSLEINTAHKKGIGKKIIELYEKALKNISEKSINIIYNYYLNPFNKNKIEGLINYLKLKNIQILNIIVQDEINKYLVKKIKNAILYAIKNKIKIKIFNIPKCILKNYEKNIYGRKDKYECYYIINEKDILPCHLYNKYNIIYCRKCDIKNNCYGLDKEINYKIKIKKYKIQGDDNYSNIIKLLSKRLNRKYKNKFVKFIKGLKNIKIMNSYYSYNFSKIENNFEYSEFFKEKRSIRISFKIRVGLVKQIIELLKKIYREKEYDNNIIKYIIRIAKKYNINTHIGLEFKNENPKLKLYFNNDNNGQFDKFINKIKNKVKVKNNKYYILAFEINAQKGMLIKYYYENNKEENKEKKKIVYDVIMKKQVNEKEKIEYYGIKINKKEKEKRFIKEKIKKIAEEMVIKRNSIYPLYYTIRIANGKRKMDKLYYIITP